MLLSLSIRGAKRKPHRNVNTSCIGTARKGTPPNTLTAWSSAKAIALTSMAHRTRFVVKKACNTMPRYMISSPSPTNRVVKPATANNCHWATLSEVLINPVKQTTHIAINTIIVGRNQSSCFRARGRKPIACQPK